MGDIVYITLPVMDVSACGRRMHVVLSFMGLSLCRCYDCVAFACYGYEFMLDVCSVYACYVCEFMWDQMYVALPAIVCEFMWAILCV